LKDVLESARDQARALSHEQSPGTSKIPKVPHGAFDVDASKSKIAQAKDPRKVEEWDPLLKRLNELANPRPPATAAAPAPAPRPMTFAPPPSRGGSFEDVVEQVARALANKVKDVNCEEANEIARLLAELAQAARNGDKKKMIECGRAIHEKGKLFCNRLRNMAANLQGKGPAERDCQDQMVKAAIQLTNNSMQLKILCSVKAASVEKNKDNDAVLTTLVHDIGVVVTNGLEGMDIARKTIFKADV